MQKTLLLISVLTLSGSALAKLPAPTDEALAKAAETAAKTAHGNKVADFKLCQSREKTAAHYYKTKGKGRPVSKVATPACADPGPYKPAALTPAPTLTVKAPTKG